MILLDPDLDAHPAAPSIKATSSPEIRKAGRDDRLPSVRTLNRFFAEAQTAVRLKGMVSVLLTTDAAIQTLNRDFRRKNKPTDVLSFPAAKISRGEVAGDLAISVDTARKQAREQGHSVGIEIKVLILHGLLHLAGYDHETDDGAMARKERALRAKLALPLGLIERVERRGRRATSDPSTAPSLRSGFAQDDKVLAGRRVSKAGPSTAPSLRSGFAQDDKHKGRGGKANAGPSTALRAKRARGSAQDDGGFGTPKARRGSVA